MIEGIYFGLVVQSFRQFMKPSLRCRKIVKFAQSICTHYSCFENQGRFVNLLFEKKKQGAKNQGHCYSKREEAAWSLLFLNNNDPVFLQPAFCKKQGPKFFKSSRP